MRILLADDHELVRDTLIAFLEQQDDFDLTPCADLPGALDLIASDGPYDLVLLDYNMPGMNGLEGLARAQSANGGLPVAIMSGSADRVIAQDALDQGAAGFLPKSMGAKTLVNAVRFISAGEVYAPVKFMTEAVEEAPNALRDSLSPRELEVLGGLCQGLSNKEIARNLDLQEVTIKLHVKTLCRKLDAKNRTQAAMIAKDAGLA